jgi:hypothetical protein
MIKCISSASDLARDSWFLLGPHLPAMITREIWGAANTLCGYFDILIDTLLATWVRQCPLGKRIEIFPWRKFLRRLWRNEVR